MMMRNLLIGVAAALAVASAATIATAQDDKDKAPAAEGKKSPGAGQKGPGAGSSEHPKLQPAPNRAEQPKSEAPKAVQREPGAQQPKAAQQPAQDKQKSTQHKQEAGKEQPKAAQQQPAPEKQKSIEQKPEPGKDQPKAAEQPAPDKRKSTEQKQEPGKDQPKAAEQPQPGKSKSAEQGTDKAAGGVQMSQEQRANVRERLVKETRVAKTNINVTVNVGRTLPRSVRLHPLPVTIVGIAPAYRSYQYVVLEDETIVIVDPRTYMVIDVISGGGPGHASLALSSADQRFLFTSLPREHRSDVRVRLALGAEVPRSVELLSFPPVAVERVPSVQRYRYIVSGDDIVIVDPIDYNVVFVINE
jgi:opacity protein-like surface antigen